MSDTQVTTRDLLIKVWVPLLLMGCSGLFAFIFQYGVLTASFDSAVKAIEDNRKEGQEAQREVSKALSAVQMSAEANSKAVSQLTKEFENLTHIVREHDIDIAALKERTKDNP